MLLGPSDVLEPITFHSTGQRQQTACPLSSAWLGHQLDAVHTGRHYVCSESQNNWQILTRLCPLTAPQLGVCVCVCGVRTSLVFVNVNVNALLTTLCLKFCQKWLICGETGCAAVPQALVLVCEIWLLTGANSGLRLVTPTPPRNPSVLSMWLRLLLKNLNRFKSMSIDFLSLAHSFF